VTDAPEWSVPVVTVIDRRPEYITVSVFDGEVVVKAPPTPYVLSPTSRTLLDEALTRAFSLVGKRDQWS
jgi:hypothetical protein